jgi:hypothetical protein
VIGYDASSLSQVSVFNTSPNGNLDTIWQGDGGLAVDVNGNLYFETGNGTDITGHGDDYSEAVMKLDGGDGMTVDDYFIPFNYHALDQADKDLGSGAPIVLPDQPGDHPHLLIASGKEGKIYLIDRDNMGGLNNPPFGPDLVVQSLPNALASGSWDTPAYFDGGDPNGPWIYYGGNGDYVKAFQLTNGLLTTSPTSHSPTILSGNYGATPVVSANGTSNGIVWALQNASPVAILHAYDATNLANELYNTNQVASDKLNQGVKFTSPIVADGKVFVPTNGQLTIYGLLDGRSIVHATAENASYASRRSATAVELIMANGNAAKQAAPNTTLVPLSAAPSTSRSATPTQAASFAPASSQENAPADLLASVYKQTENSSPLESGLVDGIFASIPPLN